MCNYECVWVGGWLGDWMVWYEMEWLIKLVKVLVWVSVCGWVNGLILMKEVLVLNSRKTWSDQRLKGKFKSGEVALALDG